MAEPRVHPHGCLYLLVPLIIVIGLGSCIAMTVKGVFHLAQTMQQVPVPGKATVSLASAGNYMILLMQPGQQGATAPLPPNIHVRVEQAATETQIPLTLAGMNVSVEVNDQSGQSVMQFTAPAPGAYVISSTYPKNQPPGPTLRLAVMNVNESFVGDTLRGVKAVGLSLVIALIVWIALLIMRSRSRRALQDGAAR